MKRQIYFLTFGTLWALLKRGSLHINVSLTEDFYDDIWFAFQEINNSLFA